jgi:ketosteroid isomerase-like protein
MKPKFTTMMIFTMWLCLFFGTGCRTVDVEAEKSLLLKTDAAFSQASVGKGSAEAFHEYLDENALMLPDGSHPILGRESIYAIMSGGTGSVLTWEPVMAEVAQSGDLGYTWGRYKSMHAGADGAIQTQYGKYLNVWKKQEDGYWKVLVDIGNTNPQPEKEIEERP